MRILVTGATGFIGRQLVKHLHLKHKLTVLSRHPRRAYTLLGNDLDVIDDLELLTDLNAFDAVINLAGEPIAHKRWTKKQKQLICQSRWQLTERLVQLFNHSSTPPAVLISGSATGFYGSAGKDKIDESFTPRPLPGLQPFTHTVCQRWETLALKAQTDNTRVCIVRTGVVLGKQGGALQKMLPAYQFGMGGKLGDGQQYLSWIHIADIVRILIYLLEHPHCSGIYNATAPYPVTNAEFSRTLAHALKRPNFTRMPAWMLQLAMGEMATLLLDSQRVIPQQLLNEQFQFCHPQLDDALDVIIHSPH